MWAEIRIFTIDKITSSAKLSQVHIAIFYTTGEILTTSLVKKLDMVNFICDWPNQSDILCYLVDGEDKNPAYHITNAIHYWMLNALPTPLIAKNLFYLSPVYLRGFWWLNQSGLRNHSKVLSKSFEPSKISDALAAKFFAMLKDTFLAKEFTTHPQTKAHVEIPDDCIAIPTQGPTTITPYRVYLQYQEIIEGVIKHKNHHQVWINPQPRMKLNTIETLAKYHDPENLAIVIFTVFCPNQHWL